MINNKYLNIMFYVLWSLFLCSISNPLTAQGEVYIEVHVLDSLLKDNLDGVQIDYYNSKGTFITILGANNTTDIEGMLVIKPEGVKDSIKLKFSKKGYVTIERFWPLDPFVTKITVKLLRETYDAFSIGLQANKIKKKKTCIPKAKFKLCGSDTNQWVISDKEGKVKIELRNFRPMQTYPILVKRRGYRCDTFFYHLGENTNVVLEKCFNCCDALFTAGVLLGAFAIRAGVKSKNFHDDYNIITNNTNRKDDLKKANCWSKISFVSGVASALAFGGSAWCYCRHHKKMHKKHKPRKT